MQPQLIADEFLEKAASLGFSVRIRSVPTSPVCLITFSQDWEKAEEQGRAPLETLPDSPESYTNVYSDPGWQSPETASWVKVFRTKINLEVVKAIHTRIVSNFRDQPQHKLLIELVRGAWSDLISLRNQKSDRDLSADIYVAKSNLIRAENELFRAFVAFNNFDSGIAMSERTDLLRFIFFPEEDAFDFVTLADYE